MRKDPNSTEKGETRALLLTREEEDLSHRLGLSFAQYSIIKEAILRESVRMGSLSKEFVFKMFKLDPLLIEHIFDFLAEQEEIIVEEEP
jgi:hypothetical protein